VSIFEILAIAVGLAMDAFAVSLAGGAGGRLRSPRPAIRLAFHLGLFQFMMPVFGWYAGSRAAPLIEHVDHWVAFALLAFVGGRMVRSGGWSDEHHVVSLDPSKGWNLVALSIATSIDAFAVGLSLAMIGVAIWQPSVIIGVVTAVLSLIGIAIGGRVGRRFGPTVEIIGGLILLAIGIRIVTTHVFG
jgi:putative Mn2+ efflux pump MntP